MIRVFGRVLVSALLVGAGSACQGGSGEVVVDDALAITAIEVRSVGGTVNIHADPALDDAQSAVHGTHALSGLGAKGRARVSIDADGVLRIEADCLPMLPCRLDLMLTVPAALPVTVDLAAGSAHLQGVATADIHVDRGDVSIIDGRTAVVRMGAGDLTAQLGADARLRAVVARGDVEVSVPPGGWQITAAANELRLSGVSLDRQASGVLDVHAPSGRVLLAGVEGLAAR